MSRTFAALLVVFALFAQAAIPVIAHAHDASGPEPVLSIDAQEGEGEEHQIGDRRDGLNDVVIWSLVGLGIFALVLGVFYFFKRQVGGFPENPAWVAPITIMPSKDFPDEGDYGNLPASQTHPEH